MKQLNFYLGSDVYCREEHCGKLIKFAVNPTTFKLTHMIVEEGLFLKRARALPISAVDYVRGDNVHLFFGSTRLEDYPEYQETLVENGALEKPVAPPFPVGTEAGITTVNYDREINVVKSKVRIGVPEEVTLIGQKTPLRNLEGEIGKLNHIVADESWKILAIGATHGYFLPERLLIPIDWVRDISENDITLRPNNKELEKLLSTAAEEEIAKQDAANALGPDSALATALIRTLRADPRLNDEPLDVINDRGIVTLIGEVDSREAKETAEAIVAQHPDVISVVNTLFIR